MDRVAAIERQRLNEVDEHARAFDMAQELVPQADAAVGAFDQAGQVGDDEDAFAARMDDAEVRMLGRERIVGDFGMRLRQPAQQRRFARVGQADQAGVGDDFQFEDEPAFLAVLAGLGFLGSAIGAGGEGLVAAPAVATFADDDFVAVFDEVAQDMAAFAIVDDGPRRHGDDDVLAVASGLLRAAAGAAVDGAPVFAIDDVGEAVGAGDDTDDDAAAVPAVAAVGAACGFVLFAAEAAAAASAVAALDEDGDSIDEHDGFLGVLERFNGYCIRWDRLVSAS